MTKLIKDIQPPNKNAATSESNADGVDDDLTIISLTEEEQNDIDQFQDWFKTLNPILQTSIRAIVNVDPDSNRDPIPVMDVTVGAKNGAALQRRRRGSFIDTMSRPDTNANDTPSTIDNYPTTEVIASVPNELPITEQSDSTLNELPASQNTTSNPYYSFQDWYNDLSDSDKSAFNANVRGIVASA